MGLRLLRQRRAGLRPSGEQIRQIELGSDMNRCRAPLARHEMVELYVRCRLTQPLQMRLALDSLSRTSRTSNGQHIPRKVDTRNNSPPLRRGGAEPPGAAGDIHSRVPLPASTASNTVSLTCEVTWAVA